MAGVNKVILVGHLGADPEARSMNNGGEVVSFRIATSESWKNQAGERQERTEWHNVVIFNEPLGKIAKSYLRKGSKAYVEGQLQTRKWTDQSGNERYTTEVVLQKFRGEICLLDGKEERKSGYNDREDYTPPPAKREQTRPTVPAGGYDTNLDLDDDVPF
jgi:single-strand DNA-binding protein